MSSVALSFVVWVLLLTRYIHHKHTDYPLLSPDNHNKPCWLSAPNLFAMAFFSAEPPPRDSDEYTQSPLSADSAWTNFFPSTYCMVAHKVIKSFICIKIHANEKVRGIQEGLSQ